MWIEIKTKEVLSNLDSQEVFGGEMGWSFKPFANFGCAEILGSTFVGCEG